MKALTYTALRQSSVVDAPAPKIGDDDVLIKVAFAGLCGTDIHMYNGEYFSGYPIIPGHEFSGTVEAVGKNVSAFTPGQHVAADPNCFCEKCYFCKQNLQNHCLDLKAIGVTVDGGFAEYVSVPQSSVFDVSGIDLMEAAFIEPLACVVYGQHRARPELAGNVLIFGAGAIGLMHLQLAKINGAANVTVVDVKRDRLDKALAMGADQAVAAGADQDAELAKIAPYGFSLVIDATGVPAVVQSCLKYVRNAGTLLIFGVCPNDSGIIINPYEVFKRDLTITGSFAIRKTFIQAIELMKNKKIDTKPLIGDIVTLHELPGAVERMAAGQSSMKTLVDMSAL